MVVENLKVVTLVYDIHNGEQILEQVTAERPLTYCHGEKMVPAWVEEILAGKAEGESFDEPLFMAEGHPLHGQDVRFRGQIIQIRDVMDWELEWIRNPEKHCGGHCHGGCHGGECKGDCKGDCQGDCQGNCGGECNNNNECKHNNNGEHTCSGGKA
ncbi:MAG: hypothetical protein MJZ75_02500 [Paludibacteraceae bacterium]|nr:hypothetical protein [Paludibacteraceae bacterium]